MPPLRNALSESSSSPSTPQRVEPRRAAESFGPRDCPMCTGDAEPTFSKYGVVIATCRRCSHRFADVAVGPDHVEMVFGDEYFVGDGDGYVDYEAMGRSLVALGQRYGQLLTEHRRTSGNRLLDVGAAAGYVTEGLAQRGWNAHGIDPNKTMCRRAADRGVDVRYDAFEDYAPADVLDAVSIIQVLPHLRSPRTSLERVREMLAPGGLLLIETWDYQTRTARAFGHLWPEYNPPSTLHWFSRPGLELHLGDLGFDIVDHGHPRKWIDLGNGAEMVRQALRDHDRGRQLARALALAPRSLRVPYLLHDVFWLLARKA